MMIVWFLAVLGATLIVNRSMIAAPLRRLFPKPDGETPFFGTLVRCTQCLGFWVGAVASPLAPAHVSFLPLDALFYGSAVSGLGLILTYVLVKLGMDPNTEE